MQEGTQLTIFCQVTQHDVETSNRLGLQAWADTGIGRVDDTAHSVALVADAE